MKLSVLRTSALAVSVTLLLMSLALNFVSIELPAVWVLVPIFAVFCLQATACMTLAKYDPHGWSPLFFSWKCLREYASAQPGDKLVAAGGIWFGGFLYVFFIFGREEPQPVCDGICLVQSAQLASFLAITGMISFAAAVLLDASIYWKRQQKVKFP